MPLHAVTNGIRSEGQERFQMEGYLVPNIFRTNYCLLSYLVFAQCSEKLKIEALFVIDYRARLKLQILELSHYQIIIAMNKSKLVNSV